MMQIHTMNVPISDAIQENFFKIILNFFHVIDGAIMHKAQGSSASTSYSQISSFKLPHRAAL